MTRGTSLVLPHWPLGPDIPKSRRQVSPSSPISIWLLFNARSIVNKIAELDLFVNCHNPSVVAITETWLSDDIPDSIFCPKGYYVFRKDRKSIGGGVALLIRNDICAASVPLRSALDIDMELTCADITINGLTYRTVVYYRPPHYSNEDFAYFRSSLQCLQELSESMSPTILLGDFNLPDMDWSYYTAPNNDFYNLFVEFINENAFHQFTQTPTRLENILDLVLTNCHSVISDLQVLCPFSSSDHNVVQFNVNLPTHTCDPVIDMFYYDFPSANFDMIDCYLANIYWAHEFSFVFSANDYWDLFLMHLYHAIELYVPVKRKSTKTHNHRNYPRYLKNMLSRKSLLWKRWHMSKIIKHKKAYDAYAIKCTKAITSHHAEIELRLVQSNDVGKFYRFINNKLNRKLPVPPIKNANDELITNYTDQANIFNDYFASVFTTDDGNKPKLANRSDSNFSTIDLTPA